jgi:hypothetical protein
MVEIKNVVIFGDSMSDIGTKWQTFSGGVGRLINALGFGGMRVNEAGRFSDGKNWTDFLVEWATGETLMWGNSDLSIRKSSDYLRLSENSVLGVNPWTAPAQSKPPASDADLDTFLKWVSEARKPEAPGPEITYANYSEGGCVVTRDWTPKGGFLSYLRGQVDAYIDQRQQRGKYFTGATMHVIWIGLNDFVTAKRPDYDPAKVKNLPATNDYGKWLEWSQQNPGAVKGNEGVGVFPAVLEIQALIELINSNYPAAGNYFMVIDLPSIYNAVRYMEGIADAAMIKEARSIDPLMQRFNAMLGSLVAHWPGPNAPAPGHVHLVQMSRWMDFVSADTALWNLNKQAQDHGVLPVYSGSVPPASTRTPAPLDMRRRITTSDLGHPTEAVYGLMARYFVAQLLAHGHTLGRLTADSWAKYAPYKTLPFEPPQ